MACVLNQRSIDALQCVPRDRATHRGRSAFGTDRFNRERLFAVGCVLDRHLARLDLVWVFVHIDGDIDALRGEGERIRRARDLQRRRNAQFGRLRVVASEHDVARVRVHVQPGGIERRSDLQALARGDSPGGRVDRHESGPAIGAERPVAGQTNVIH